jgi:NADH dehydrogenase
VAIQQGRFVAKLIARRLRNRPLPTFRYREFGNMATIGRSAAVADFGKLHFSGFIAWAMWLVVHLINLISFRNRLLVLLQWAWHYFTYDGSARLITTREAPERDAARPSPAPIPPTPVASEP